MKLDGFAIQYLLSLEYSDVTSSQIMRYAFFDYPILYDDTVDMSGHTVLVPEHERPFAGPHAQNVLYVCIGGASTEAAREAGASVIRVHGDVTFRQLYNYMQSVFVRNERLDAQLNAYVTSYAGFQALLDACAEAMNCTCALIDEQFRIVAQAGGQGQGASDLLEPETIDLFMGSSSYRRRRASRKAFTIPGSNDLLMKNIFSGDHLIGTLIMSHERTTLHANYTLFLLNYLCPFIEEMFSRIGTFHLPSSRLSRVRAMLHGAFTGDAAGIAGLSSALIADGHDPHARYAALRIERSFTHEGTAELDYLAHRFELALPHTYCFTEEGRLYMLADIGTADADARGAFMHELPPIARDNLAKVGVSRPFLDMTQFQNACRQADIALLQGSVTNPTYWYYRFNAYALPWIFDRMSEIAPAEMIGHAAIFMLDAYDKQHGTELLQTLKVFMRCRYNATAAAHELFVARSTLLNRLERVQEITQIDLDDPEERLYLTLSFGLARR